jgi:hypothetical protein
MKVLLKGRKVFFRMIGKLLVAAGIAVAPLAVPVFTAPAAHAQGCAPGYVVGVPMSNGRLPVKCVPKGNIPPGYVDGTGGNAPLDPGYGPTGQPN